MRRNRAIETTRALVTLAVVAALAPLGLPTTPRPTAAAAPVRPNVLNIVLDDMRDDTLARMRAYMPKTVQWFAPGTFFSNADVSTPSCCPARATGMTGQYDHNNQMKHQHDIANFDCRHDGAARPAPGAGYQTALVGKFLHDWPLTTAPPDFDSYAMWQTNEYRNPVINVGGTTTTKLPATPPRWPATSPSTTCRSHGGRPAGQALVRVRRLPRPAPSSPTAWRCLRRSTPALRSVTAGPPTTRTSRTCRPYVKWARRTVAQAETLCESQRGALMSVDDQINRLLTELKASGAAGQHDGHPLERQRHDVGRAQPDREVRAVPAVGQRLPVHPLGRAGGLREPGTDLVSNVDLAPTIYVATGVSPGAAVVHRRPVHACTGQRPYEFNEYWYDVADAKVPDWAQLHNTHFAYIETYKPTPAPSRSRSTTTSTRTRARTATSSRTGIPMIRRLH